jgi:hypothetical protein
MLVTLPIFNPPHSPIAIKFQSPYFLKSCISPSIHCHPSLLPVAQKVVVKQEYTGTVLYVNLMAIGECGGLKIGSVTSIHCKIVQD